MRSRCLGWLVALLCLLLAATGCMRGPGPRHASEQGLEHDLSLRDGAPDDRRPPGDGSSDSLRVDGGVVSPDHGATDQASDRGSACVPFTTVDPNAKMCGQQCLSALNDADCDGLPDARDPSEGCQPLLLNEDFAIDPVMQPARWMVNTPAKVSWSCGRATLGSGVTLNLANPALLSSATTGPYLVETRFTLGAAVDPANWRVAIRVGLTTGAQFNCEVWMNSQFGVSRPGAHLGIDACSQVSGSWDMAPGAGVGAVGETYVLQFWYDSTAHCRVLRDDGSLQSEKNFYSCAVSRPDAFQVSVTSREVTLHHVRAFAYPN